MALPVQFATQLVTDRLLLRGHRLDDFDAMVTLWQHETTYRYITGRPSTPMETWSRLHRYVGHWQLLGFGYWAVEDRRTGAYLGELGFADFHRDIDPPFGKTPEAGWVLDPTVHGQGLATEALAAAHAWMDAQTISDRTVCILHPDHASSRRVAEKQGYAFVRTARYMDGPTTVMERIKSPVA